MSEFNLIRSAQNALSKPGLRLGLCFSTPNHLVKRFHAVPISFVQTGMCDFMNGSMYFFSCYNFSLWDLSNVRMRTTC